MSAGVISSSRPDSRTAGWVACQDSHEALGEEVDVHRFLQDVDHPEVDPGQGVVEAAVAGEDQDREPRVELADPAQRVDAVSCPAS